MVAWEVVLPLSSALSLRAGVKHGHSPGMSYPLGFCLAAGLSMGAGITLRPWGRPILRRGSTVSQLAAAVLSLSGFLRFRWFRCWTILSICRAVLRFAVLIFGKTWKRSGWLRLSGQWMRFNFKCSN